MMTLQQRHDVGDRLISRYGLDPDVAFVAVRAGPEPVLLVKFYPGHEDHAPDMPAEFQGMAVERGRTARFRLLGQGRPGPCGPAFRKARNLRREDGDPGPLRSRSSAPAARRIEVAGPPPGRHGPNGSLTVGRRGRDARS